LEDDELAAAVLAAVDDGDDVRVRELRHRPGLAAEALHVRAVAAVVVVQDLQRDVPFEQRVVRLEDARHPARANELAQLVPAGDHLTYHESEIFPGTSLLKRRLERLLPDVERLVELRVREHERAEHPDAVRVDPRLEEQEPAL